MEIILAKNKNLNNAKGKEKVSNMIKVATLTRKGFIAGDISTVMSPRTVLHWVENSEIFKDIGYGFRVTFLNKCDEIEKNIISEYYQRCFGEELPESMLNIQSLMSKEDNFKEKFKIALYRPLTLLRTIILLIMTKNKKKSKIDLFELDKLESRSDFVKYRAEIDLGALKRKFSNTEIFRNNYPQNSSYKQLYELSEKIRCEILM